MQQLVLMGPRSEIVGNKYIRVITLTSMYYAVMDLTPNGENERSWVSPHWRQFKSIQCCNTRLLPRGK